MAEQKENGEPVKWISLSELTDRQNNLDAINSRLNEGLIALIAAWYDAAYADMVREMGAKTIRIQAPVFSTPNNPPDAPSK